MLRLGFWTFAIFSVLSACTLEPEYKRPLAPIPSTWPSGPAYKEVMAGYSVSELSWNEFLTDERMKKIVILAMKNNRDLKLSLLNVEKARALYGIQQAELIPAVNAIGRGSREKVPSDLSETRKRMTRERYSVDLGILSWEIDLFGRIRSLSDQALEEYLATEEARRAAELSIVSAVVEAYLSLAAYREMLEVSESTLENQENVYRLIKQRLEVGLASQLDLHRAQTQVESARAEVARYRKLVAQGENALNLLAGSPVPADLLPADLSGVSPCKEISPGISSEVLLRRPDILSAEHRLRALNANIGAARAAFFPRITLTATIGTASRELSGLFNSGSGTWSFVPQIVMPIFDTRTWLALKAVKVEREAAVAQYEKAIQTAFKEVADALAERGTILDQIKAQETLVRLLSETHRLAYLRYTKGIDSYLSVLDAQRSLYGAKQGLTALRLAELSNRVILYKALGGGQVAR